MLIVWNVFIEHITSNSRLLAVNRVWRSCSNTAVMDATTTCLPPNHRDTGSSSAAHSTDFMLLNIVITEAADNYKLLQSEEQNMTISCVQVPNHRYCYLSLSSARHTHTAYTLTHTAISSDSVFSQVYSSIPWSSLSLSHTHRPTHTSTCSAQIDLLTFTWLYVTSHRRTHRAEIDNFPKTN